MTINDILNHPISASFIGWFFSHGITIISISIAALLVHAISGKLIERVVRRAVARGMVSKEAEEKRENTLISVIHGVVYVATWLIALLMVLSEVGIAIAPILAAAGIVGVAVGFGGQYLIRDLISGLFILLENQYRVADVVCFDNTCGLVEEVTLRMTTLRDLDGTVHHVPHGEITRVSNLSKGFSRVNLNIGVSYAADLSKVIEVVNRVGEELAADPAWKDSIIDAPKFLRVDDFADSSVVIKILGDTLPIKQWDVAGELRMRLKIAFDAEGIELPFPQRTVHLSPVS